MTLVDISELAREVVATLRHTEPEREVDIRVEDGLGATGDRALIRAVLENLIGNAWKFTRPRNPAKIDVGRKDGAFFVRDNGVGYEPAFAAKLFQPFQRLHPSSDFPGTGIGLVSVARIVARHGGVVRAEGAVDEGATFYFTLPERNRE
ncbi:MAG: hypothetical protein QOG85_1068 [Gaiellaceae bacterium]|nr:hypothetical protein [Gaiellaceae bacterium]